MKGQVEQANSRKRNGRAHSQFVQKIQNIKQACDAWLPASGLESDKESV